MKKKVKTNREKIITKIVRIYNFKCFDLSFKIVFGTNTLIKTKLNIECT